MPDYPVNGLPATMLRMRYGLAWLWAFYRSPQGKKLYRYVMGSVITTIVSFAVLTLVYGVFRWWGAVASTVFANVVATVPAYWLNRTWTWGKGGRSDLWREVMPFWVLSIAGIAISMGTADLAAAFGRAHDLHHLVELVVVDGANLAAYGVLFVGKYLVFDRLFRLAESVRTAQPRPGVPAPSSLHEAGVSVRSTAEPAAPALRVAPLIDLRATMPASSSPVDAELLLAGARASASGPSRTGATPPWVTTRVLAVHAHPAGRAITGGTPEHLRTADDVPGARPPSWLAGLVARWTAPVRQSAGTDWVGASPTDS